MSKKGNCCLDNACMETFFSHLKCECIYLTKFKNDQEVIQAVDRYIDFYNTERFQAKLENLSPMEYRAKVA